MTGKNIWRLCKLYGRLIGYPMLKPHDIRHGVAMEVLEQRHDLEQVRALLGHQRIDTTQIYTMIRPAQLSKPCRFTKSRRDECWKTSEASANPCSRNIRMFLKHGANFPNKFNVVVPTGFEPVFEPLEGGRI